MKKNHIRIDDTKASEIIEAAMKIREEYGISERKFLGIISDSRNHVDGTLSVKEEYNYEKWGSPTEENIEWINNVKNNESELFQKLEGKIKFNGDKIIIDGMKFDSNELEYIGEGWEGTMKEAKKVEGRRLPEDEEFEKLFDLFTIGDIYYSDVIKKLLGLTTHNYWSATEDSIYTDCVWYGNFTYGCVSSGSKFSTDKLTLCTHD